MKRLSILYLLVFPIFSLFSSPPEIDLSNYERQIFSQSGEDGVISKILEVVGVSSKYYVEFGACDGQHLSNTKNLRDNYGWKGLLLDGGNENPSLNLHKEFITAENINEIFRKYNVSYNLDLLSIDIDYNDFYVWNALDEKYKPRLIVVEYNSIHLPHKDKVVKYVPFGGWDGSNYFGGSILSFYNLGRKKGYSLVYANKIGVNLFFVRNDLIKKSRYTFKNVNNVNKLYRSPGWGLNNEGHRKDPLNREYISSKLILK